MKTHNAQSLKNSQKISLCSNSSSCTWPGSIDPVEKCPVCGSFTNTAPALVTEHLIAYEINSKLHIRQIQHPEFLVNINHEDLIGLADFINFTMLKRENEFRLHKFRESLELLLEQLNDTIFVKDTIKTIKKETMDAFNEKIKNLDDRRMELFNQGYYHNSTYTLKIERYTYEHALELVNEILDFEMEKVQKSVV
jgi:hypothetical protein